MKVRCHTSFGQSLCVVGSIPELGSWREYKCHMQWTEGHVWVTKNPLVTSKSYFSYKYVLFQESKVKRWEKGIDRIADLRLLTCDKQKS